MGYTHYAPSLYIAPPHAAYLGLIEEERIITPEESGTFTLSDMYQTGPAALQMELDNPAIEKAITDEVSKVGLAVDDYVLYIGKIFGRAEVAVYATPSQEKMTERAPIFLVQRLGIEKQIKIADGPNVKAISANRDTVTLDLQLAK